MERKHRPFVSMWLRRTLGPGFFVAFYAAGVSVSWANEHLKVEYLIFTHQGPFQSSPKQDTRHNHLLALDELSSVDTDFGKGHSLLSDSGVLKAHKTQLSTSPFYRVTLHAQAAIPITGEISPVRFRVKRKGVAKASDIRIVFSIQRCTESPGHNICALHPALWRTVDTRGNCALTAPRNTACSLDHSRLPPASPRGGAIPGTP